MNLLLPKSSILLELESPNMDAFKFWKQEEASGDVRDLAWNGVAKVNKEYEMLVFYQI